MEPIDPNQSALATAAERLGELLEQAATAHELEEVPRREVWRQLAEAAIPRTRCAEILRLYRHERPTFGQIEPTG